MLFKKANRFNDEKIKLVFVKTNLVPVNEAEKITEKM
jgi:hypothetical protein